MIVRTWKSVGTAAALPLKGLRYDAGSWIAEILDNSWTSYDVVKRRKISETAWEEWLMPHRVPRLPRDSFGVEEFKYNQDNGLVMMKEWSWQQVQQVQQVQEQQQQQPPPQQQPPSLQQQPRPQQPQHPQQRRPSQNRPQKQTFQQPSQTSQQHPTQAHGVSAQQPVNRTYNQPIQSLQFSSGSVDHSQPILADQQKQGSRSSQHRSRQPPPPPKQPVNLPQPSTLLEQSPVSGGQYYTPPASFPHPKDSEGYSPRSKGRRQGTSGRAHSGSYPQGNATQAPVTCQILD